MTTASGTFRICYRLSPASPPIAYPTASPTALSIAAPTRLLHGSLYPLISAVLFATTPPPTPPVYTSRSHFCLYPLPFSYHLSYCLSLASL
ncbi:hypothetical protein BDZ91DRAFT_744439 [Kalaharituber pfeilii]|nr:hypothetical protein BDZ91DRAFT_744439 [Kalaharituber pfeilii]